MAREVITKLIDDLDGGEASQTVEFGIDGVTYSIDLSDKNAVALREAVGPYLAVAQRVGRVGGGGGITRAIRGAAASVNRHSREENQRIREWAARNGYEISERGRIPVDVVEAFRSGTPNPAGKPAESVPDAPAEPVAESVKKPAKKAPAAKFSGKK